MEAIDPRWRKSSYSGNGGDCVEVGEARRGVLARDTKQNGAGPVLRFTPAAWRRFADQVKRSLADPKPWSGRRCGGTLVSEGAPFAVSSVGMADSEPEGWQPTRGYRASLSWPTSTASAETPSDERSKSLCPRVDWLSSTAEAPTQPSQDGSCRVCTADGIKGA